MRCYICRLYFYTWCSNKLKLRQRSRCIILFKWTNIIVIIVIRIINLCIVDRRITCIVLWVSFSWFNLGLRNLGNTTTTTNMCSPSSADSFGRNWWNRGLKFLEGTTWLLWCWCTYLDDAFVNAVGLVGGWLWSWRVVGIYFFFIVWWLMNTKILR